MAMELGLAGKIAVITGGSVGVGLAAEPCRQHLFIKTETRPC
jgi:hypothetical protein